MSNRSQAQRALAIFGVLVFVSLFVSCGTLSPDTVTLSNAITNRVKDMERSHIHAVNALFDTEIQRVDKFMDEIWIPLFLRNFLGISMILEDLKKVESIGAKTLDQITIAAGKYLDDESESGTMAKKIVDALNIKRGNEVGAVRTIVKEFVPDDKVDPATIHINALLNLETPAVLIMAFAQEANSEIKKQRQSLIAPIEEARKLTRAAISQDYVDIYAGQGVITARLEAAVRKDQAQVQLLDAIGGEGASQKINTQLLSFSHKMKDVLGNVEDIKKKFESTKEVSGGGSADFLQNLQNEIRKALVTSGLIDSGSAAAQ